ncbi:nuclear transport factor 2 family protein [Antarctobacter heliothermus]|uniref:Ketosteroid isomerase-related protein n=1 Tax=Antarctobacter heliothermus TaxID=74033 RepID=A0A239ATV9_9RHOB|nr:nuclear transport factor 2 family protein [Antarctobacter heliothermus]SNR98408.1 Ketosteroid isomerase-related protein [Antarctobacter heliothermus]
MTFIEVTLKEIADALVAGCREGHELEILDKLYAADAVSVEAMAMPGMDSPETHGIDGIKGKHAWWSSNFEVLESTVSGPFLHGDSSFAVIFEMKAKHRESGEVSDMHEVAIYTVGGGKIVREAFYYNM